MQRIVTRKCINITYALFILIASIKITTSLVHHGKTSLEGGTPPSPYRKTIDSLSPPVFDSFLPVLVMRNKRRDVLLDIITSAIAITSTGIISSPPLARASEEEDITDLTTKMFNFDGSFKQPMETVAKFRNIDFTWDVSDQLAVAINGINTVDTRSGSSVAIQYKLPEKWGKDNDMMYVDQSEGLNQKVCEKIVVYQAPGTVTMDRLEQASKVGVYKSLQLTPDFSSLLQADLIGGRSVNRNGQKYYEFDMALAPRVCDASTSDNLGLGFCPYESIFLLSSTIVNNRLYVFVEECKKEQWKRSNAELKTIRSSFIVESRHLV
jgi:hypothetical protein